MTVGDTTAKAESRIVPSSDGFHGRRDVVGLAEAAFVLRMSFVLVPLGVLRVLRYTANIHTMTRQFDTSILTFKCMHEIHLVHKTRIDIECLYVVLPTDFTITAQIMAYCPRDELKRTFCGINS